MDVDCKMNKSSVDLKVDLSEVLTPASFSTIVVQLIKYVAYNSKTIPYTYEGFSHLVNRKRHLLHSKEEQGKPSSYNDILAQNYFMKVSTAYDNYEATFKSLLEELKSHDTVRQVVFLSGNTPVNPRYTYRILKPYLSVEDVENAPPVRKPLGCVLKTLLQSSQMNLIFENSREPSDLSILIQLADGEDPKSDWFVPFDNFSLSTSRKEIKIVFNSPSPFENSVESEDTDEGTDHRETCTNWYRSKETLKGFKDIKVGGKSVVNYLLDS